MSEYFGKETPKLGFGLMRLPTNENGHDVEQVKKMVDLFIEAGFTYFDTAFVYGHSEETTSEALVKRYPRNAYTLATKMNAQAFNEEDKTKAEFETSLKRTGAGYFDYYLLHAIMENNYQMYNDFGIWEFAKEKKEQGLIKYLGFSFHDGPQLLDRILTEHPEVDFVQLQINYEDWENPAITSRANYEVARKHGKSIVVMEPIKGGSLANPPEKVKELFDKYNPNMSYASWAIRFAASLDGVITVLSGMSNLQQMEDNLSYMKNFMPLNEEEQHIIQEAQRIIGNSSTIPCTACHYCTDGCPMNIHIPEIFKAANKHLGNGLMADAKKAYDEATKEGSLASECIDCKQCEGVCPQHLEITNLLAKCAKLLEK